MSEFLSQDQINALLQQHAVNSLEVPTDSDMGATGASQAGVDNHAIESAISLFCDHASKVLSTVLNQQVSCTVSQSQEVTSQNLKTGIAAPAFLLSCPMTGGVTGELKCVTSSTLIATLADLMMMGEGNAPFTEEHKDAAIELFNQIMGSFAVALGERCDNSVASSGVGIAEFDLDSSPAKFTEGVLVPVTVAVGSLVQAVVGVIVPRDIGEQCTNIFGENRKLEDSGSDGQTIFESNDLFAGGSDLPISMPEDNPALSATMQREPSLAAPKENIAMILDVELDIYIELGRTNLSIKRILELAPGSIVELDRLAGEPVDLIVNSKIVAKGEVVVVDENFGIRIVSLISPEERIKILR